ncbi:MAG: NAD-dependent epimerase/dehydratase family protein [Bacteroidales bacterium]|jgi:nucleoside-diphosphate-sugar epimerase
MNILVVGAGGQIGTELIPHLQSLYGEDNVIAADLKKENVDRLGQISRALVLDALDMDNYKKVISEFKIDRIYNLVALLSATGEKSPQIAWQINMGALINSLELAREYNCSVFTPSSIGVFGHSTPHVNTPQDTVMRPNTIYGVCKVSGELLSDYYHTRFGVDTRSVRFPGIISNGALPGGGTTDYAVEVFYEILKDKSYVCPIPQDTYMDMLYMPDALKACTDLMDCDPSRLKHRNSFNVTAMSFSPKEIFAEIKKHVSDAKFQFDPDPVKTEISASWPDSMDDSCAREEWGWNPKWNLESMTKDMLSAISAKLSGK